MKNKLSLLFTFFFLFFANQSYSNPINKISFIGLNSSIESSLLDVLTFQTGQDYSSEISNQIIQELFDTGYFSDIQVIKKSNELEITVKENPFIKFFEISLAEPNPWTNWINPEEQLYTKEEIDELVHKNNLSAGNVFSNVKFDNFIMALKNEYISYYEFTKTVWNPSIHIFKKRKRTYNCQNPCYTI